MLTEVWSVAADEDSDDYDEHECDALSVLARCSLLPTNHNRDLLDEEWKAFMNNIMKEIIYKEI